MLIPNAVDRLLFLVALASCCLDGMCSAMIQAARQTAEERLQAVESAMVSDQASLHMPHSLLSHSTQLGLAQLTERPQPGSESGMPELDYCKAGSGFGLMQGLSAQEGSDGVMADGTTMQVTNPLFSQQEAVQTHSPDRRLDAGMAEPANPAQCDNRSQSQPAGSTNQDLTPSMAELADPDQHLSPGCEQNPQQQIDSLHSQLSAQASKLQTSEAATEYIQRLLNAVSTENHEFRKQLDRKQILKRSASELYDSSSSPAGSAKAKGVMAEPVIKGTLGLQPVTSQIAALWASTPSVRRSLLPEYGMLKPYGTPGQALIGAESLVGPSDSVLTESHSDSVSDQARHCPSNSEPDELQQLLTQPLSLLLRQVSQHESERGDPSVSGKCRHEIVVEYCLSVYTGSMCHSPGPVVAQGHQKPQTTANLAACVHVSLLSVTYCKCDQLPCTTDLVHANSVLSPYKTW